MATTIPEPIVARRPLLAFAILLTFPVLLSACWPSAGRSNNPPPLILVVEVLGGGEYRYGGDVLDRPQIEQQLERVAVQGRHPTTGMRHKTQVQIEAPQGSANADARSLGSYCQRVGLPLVVFIAR